MKIEKLVPDSSILVEGILTKRLADGKISADEIIIPQAMIALLESYAVENKAVGYLGIDQLDMIKDMERDIKANVSISGLQPRPSEMRWLALSDIDSIARKLAYDEGATFITTDKIQARLAKAQGLNCILEDTGRQKKILKLEKFFDLNTMSVHLREDVKAYAKKGMPGSWDFVQVGKDPLTQEDIQEISREIIEEAKLRKGGFIEIERPGSTIVQLDNLRIVITKPPFSDGWEITAVRPVKKLTLDEYEISEKLLQRITELAEGILIAGAPGHGKTTFAQALAEHFQKKNKVIKTIEAPRDLSLSDEITQYSINYGSNKEIHDILLLSRPDYTIFDEMRNTDDFRLFSDLRLSGVGMIGVMHATKPIDAIQRFIGRIELGVIPHVIDTVIFIKDGFVEKIFSLSMEVKVPSGMIEADLARPVVIINDFNTGRLEFEMYSYGEETVVIPVKVQQASPARKLAEESIVREIKKYVGGSSVEMLSDHKCKIVVPVGSKGELIGRGGERINDIQAKLGIHIDVVEQEQKKSSKRDGRSSTIPYQVKIDKKSVLLKVPDKFSFQEMDIYLEGAYLLSATASKKAIIKIAKQNKIGRIIVNAINDNEQLELRGS